MVKAKPPRNESSVIRGNTSYKIGSESEEIEFDKMKILSVTLLLGLTVGIQTFSNALDSDHHHYGYNFLLIITLCIRLVRSEISLFA